PKESKMKALAIKETENLPATPAPENPYLKIAAEGGDNPGQLLKFVKGKWMIGDEQVAIGTEYVCYLNQAMRGWTKFEDNKATNRVIGKIADGFTPPERSELGDTDEAKWKRDEGEPRDPWVHQYMLPMVSVDTGELITYVTGSEGGRIAVQD